MTRLPRPAPGRAALGLGALVLALAFLTPPLPADAQPARRVPTVGFVGLPTDPSESRWQDGFARGLQELGYVPGQTIQVDVRSYTSGDQLQGVLEEFVRRKVDVIFVGQPFVALAARRATRGIPIVCGSCGDPTENGLAASLARPGGNVTGLASLSAELIAKRLELMKEVLPADLEGPRRGGPEAGAGALMAYGPDRVDLYRRAAGFVDRILKGARPGELPFEQATKLDLVLNLKTARALGVMAPPSFVQRADRVIE